MPASTADETSNKIPPVLEQQIAELIASYEIAMERLERREKALEEQFQSSARFLDSQIDKINALMADLREIMTESGAARWRLSAQEALKLGDNQLQALRKLNEETREQVKESCSRFERMTNATIKNIHDAISGFKVDEFKQYVEQSYDQVKTASAGAIARMADILRWFHWKNITLSLGLSLVIAVIMGLYINDEWPWEIHQNVVKQREAGKALMNAWPHLSKSDQQYLEQKILNISKNENS